MGIVISSSTKAKFDATTNGTKHIIFGDSDYSDFMKHKIKSERNDMLIGIKMRIGQNPV